MFFSRSNMQLLLIDFYNDHCDYQENISLVDEVLLTHARRERGKKTESLSLALDDLRG